MNNRNLKGSVLQLATTLINAVDAIGYFLWQFIDFTMRVVRFFTDQQFFKQNFGAIFLVFCVAAVQWEWLIINEELLVLYCFGMAIFVIMQNMSDSVSQSLNERADNIRKELTSFLLIKQESLNQLYQSEQSLLDTESNLALLEEYCQSNFIRLEHSQEQALAGLVAQNFVQKLDAISNISSGSAPYVHKQLSLSFRETVLEAYHLKQKAISGKKRSKRKSQKRGLKAAIKQLSAL